MPTTVQSIRINNLLSFNGDTPPLELKPLNLFIGPNGSGKSNLLEIFALLQGTSRDLPQPIREGGGIIEWLWKGKGPKNPVSSIEVVVRPERGSMPIRYRLAFTRVGYNMEITEELIQNEKYEDFRISIRTERHKYQLILLLVDSEGPVANHHTAWQHLKQRPDDNWDKPPDADDQTAHLMVQCMESWFLADKDTLERYFGDGFLRRSLPGQVNIESIPKNDVLNGLERAARPSTQKHYHKTNHGYELLGLINPERVGDASVRARALNTLMAAQV